MSDVGGTGSFAGGAYHPEDVDMAEGMASKKRLQEEPSFKVQGKKKRVKKTKSELPPELPGALPQAPAPLRETKLTGRAKRSGAELESKAVQTVLKKKVAYSPAAKTFATKAAHDLGIGARDRTSFVENAAYFYDALSKEGLVKEFVRFINSSSSEDQVADALEQTRSLTNTFPSLSSYQMATILTNVNKLGVSGRASFLDATERAMRIDQEIFSGEERGANDDLPFVDALMDIPLGQREAILAQTTPLLRGIKDAASILELFSEMDPHERAGLIRRAEKWIKKSDDNESRAAILSLLRSTPPEREEAVGHFLLFMPSLPPGTKLSIIDLFREKPQLFKKETFEYAHLFLDKTMWKSAIVEMLQSLAKVPQEHLRDLPKELLSEAAGKEEKLSLIYAISLIPLGRILKGEIRSLTLDQLALLPAALHSLQFLSDQKQTRPAHLALKLSERIKAEGVPPDSPQASFYHQVLHDLAQVEIARENPQAAFEIEKLALDLFPITPTHPLWDLQKAISEATLKQYNPNTGAYFSAFDSSLVKGGHLHASLRNIDGQPTVTVDFKISHYARDELTPYLEAIASNSRDFQARLPEGLCTGVSIRGYVPHQYIRFDPAANQFTRSDAYSPGDSKATQIEFEGAGKVVIGTSQHNGIMYNWIQVEMTANFPPGVGVKKLQEMLGAVGLGPVLGKQPKEADERMKIAQLYRAFFPSDCSQFDTKKEFYRLPIAQLKERIVQATPEMKEIFAKYLERSPELMKKVSTMPGKEVWAISDLGEQMKEAGAWGLMQGVGNSKDGWESAKKSIVNLLSKGAMSSEQRFQMGLFKAGVSTERDFASGGADQVFTRLVNDRVRTSFINQMALHGNAQVLWNLDSVVQRVPYGYEGDHYGVKNRFQSYHYYSNRKDLCTLAQTDILNNELMVKDFLDPSHMVGVVVETEERRRDLIAQLLKSGLAVKKAKGKIFIKIKDKEVAANEFIHVGSQFSKEWFLA